MNLLKWTRTSNNVLIAMILTVHDEAPSIVRVKMETSVGVEFA